MVSLLGGAWNLIEASWRVLAAIANMMLRSS